MRDFGFDIAKDIVADYECFWKRRQLLISNTATVTNVPPKLLLVSFSENKIVSFSSLDKKDCFESLCSPLEQHLLFNFQNQYLRRGSKVKAHSSCNGLLLIQIDEDLCVWNPLTSFFSNVLTYKGEGYDCSAELCFNSSRNEYKVVFVKASRSYSWKDECFFFATCGVTSWEKIEVPYTIENVHLSTLFDGKKHWICKGRLSHYGFDEDHFVPPNHIVYFNPRIDLFVEIPIPKPKKGDRDTLVGLGVLDGCLCVTRLGDSCNYKGNIEFLAMRKYRDEDSWVIIFVISNVPGFRCNGVIQPLFKRNEGEVLISMYMCDRGRTCDASASVKLYDVNGKFFRDMLVSTENDFFKVMLYEESFASLTCYEGRDLDYESHRQIYLSELGDSFENEFQSRKKKSCKKMEKKNHRMKKKNQHSKKDHCWRTSIETGSRRKGWKGKKRNYEAKCGYINFHFQHDLSDNHEGKVVKIKRRRAPHISYKTSVRAESYKPMRHSSFDILEDLFIEILSRLPLDSLARFKSVSKQWQHLISNTIITRNVTKLLIVSYLENQGLSFHSLDQEIRVESLCSPMEENLLPSYGVRAHSSFNGFLLIQIKDDLVMWNPLTKFFRKVFHGHDAPYYGVIHEIGLCFDHVNNEYKIVLVKKVSSRSYSAEIFYVASCGASSWEQLNIPNTVKNVYQGPVFNGYKHWICKGRFSPFHQSIPPTRNHIVYFDPSTNEFIEVATPQPKKGDTYAIVGLGVLDGCLCMSCWDDMGNYVEFLSMKEYGNGDSWNILFVISNVPNFHYYDTMEPLFKTKEGEVLISMNTGRKWSVKTYSVDGNFRRDIFASRRYSFLQLVLYEENWISPIKSFIRL